MIVEKLSTGIKRLDDLLYGGIPIRSNIMVYGPPFIGKEWLITRFIAKGLEEGQPSVAVLTNSGVEEFREELRKTLKTERPLEEYEQKGLIRYVDAYTRIIGDTSVFEGAYYVESFADTTTILRMVDSALRDVTRFNLPIRFGFISISTLVVNISSQAAFRLAYMIAGVVKRYRGTGLYAVDSGMHSESEVSTFAHLMDGILEFREEFEPEHKTYLRVLGLGQVKSRNWIEYVYNGEELKITGSFAIGRIV